MDAIEDVVAGVDVLFLIEEVNQLFLNGLRLDGEPPDPIRRRVAEIAQFRADVMVEAETPTDILIVVEELFIGQHAQEEKPIAPDLRLVVAIIDIEQVVDHQLVRDFQLIDERKQCQPVTFFVIRNLID